MVLIESEVMAAGTEMISFSLPNYDNKIVSAEQYKNEKVTLIIFTCNHCPYAIASWPLLIELQNKYGKEGYKTVAINPNNNPKYPDDAFDRMKEYVEKTGINFPYLFDTTQQVARNYGAVCTPDPFLFQKGKLFYHGRINDNWQQPHVVKEKSLELHIEAALGKMVKIPDRRFPSMGCSIKWV